MSNTNKIKSPPHQKGISGSVKEIATPELMFELFQDYCNKTKDKPFLVHSFVGKDGFEVYQKKERCLTYEGFKNYLFLNGIIKDPTDYFHNREKRYENYVRVCQTIKDIIRQDQIEGGMAGVYSVSITQRLNGLKEQSETTATIKEQPLFPDENN